MNKYAMPIITLLYLVIGLILGIALISHSAWYFGNFEEQSSTPNGLLIAIALEAGIAISIAAKIAILKRGDDVPPTVNRVILLLVGLSFITQFVHADAFNQLDHQGIGHYLSSAAASIPLTGLLLAYSDIFTALVFKPRQPQTEAQLLTQSSSQTQQVTSGAVLPAVRMIPGSQPHHSPTAPSATTLPTQPQFEAKTAAVMTQVQPHDEPQPPPYFTPTPAASYADEEPQPEPHEVTQKVTKPTRTTSPKNSRKVAPQTDARTAAEIAASCGLSADTVRRKVAALVAAGKAQVVEGKPARYIVRNALLKSA